MKTVEQRAHEWIVGTDTGSSSKTIWAVMMGATDGLMRFGADVPYDPSDFGRCYRLLALIPEWRGRLPEVSEAFRHWGPMVANWDEMERLWTEEAPTGKAKKLYWLMRRLVDEGRAA